MAQRINSIAYDQSQHGKRSASFASASEEAKYLDDVQSTNNLRERIRFLRKQNARFVEQLKNPNLSSEDRKYIRMTMKDTSAQIRELQKKLKGLTSKDSSGRSERARQVAQRGAARNEREKQMELNKKAAQNYQKAFEERQAYDNSIPGKIESAAKAVTTKISHFPIQASL